MGVVYLVECCVPQAFLHAAAIGFPVQKISKATGKGD